VIPAPARSVWDIAFDTLEQTEEKSKNRIYSEFTLALLLGHFLGSQQGYLFLITVGVGTLGLDIFLEICKEVRS